MARLTLIGLFLLSTSCTQLAVGGRAESKDATVSLHSKATMQAVQQANASAPRFLTELYFCKATEVVGDLQLGPWANTLMMKSKNQDLTGSTWKITSFPRQVWAAVGIDDSKVETFNDKDLAFAWVDPGPLFPAGGFVHSDRVSKEVVGATKVCSQAENPSYLMKFKKPIIVDTLPEEFAMGRMARVNVPTLQAAGAVRFTFVQREVAVRNFQKFAAGEIAKGGFLYTISKGGQNYLQFYEREAYPLSNRISAA